MHEVGIEMVRIDIKVKLDPADRESVRATVDIDPINMVGNTLTNDQVKTLTNLVAAKLRQYLRTRVRG